MVWYAEIMDSYIMIVDGEEVQKSKTVLQWWSGHPKRIKKENHIQIEIPNPPKDFNYQEWYEVDFTDDTKTDVEWKVNNEIWLEKYVRPTREPLMQKALSKIDQYKNETEQLEQGIITERKISDEQYQQWLTYLQKLKDITGITKYENEYWPREPK